MQLTQKHTFWGITCQIGPAVWPLAALKKRQNKIKAQTLNILPIRGSHAPYPADMPFGVSSGILNVIIHAEFVLIG